MRNLQRKSEVEKQIPTHKRQHFVGEIYPEIFSHTEESELSEKMPFDAAIIWFGSFRTDNCQFPKENCPVCGNENVLIPYMCGGSILSGAHTIQFYCTNCHERFVTNDYSEYFRKICRYGREHAHELKPSPKFTNCTKIQEIQK